MVKLPTSQFSPNMSVKVTALLLRKIFEHIFKHFKRLSIRPILEDRDLLAQVLLASAQKLNENQINLLSSLVLLLLIWRLSLRTTQEQIGNHLYIFKVKKDKQRDSKQPLIEPKTDNP